MNEASEQKQQNERPKVQEQIERKPDEPKQRRTKDSHHNSIALPDIASLPSFLSRKASVGAKKIRIGAKMLATNRSYAPVTIGVAW
jgi:hypothetical protein